MKVEPRTNSFSKGDEPSISNPMWQNIVGSTIARVRHCERELVVTFHLPVPAHGNRAHPKELQLICCPEGQLINPPDGGKPVQLTGMKYEIGTGPATILGDVLEIAGESSEIIGMQVTNVSHDPRSHVVGIQLGQQYGVIIGPMGLKVLFTKELDIEFRKALVTI